MQARVERFIGAGDFIAGHTGRIDHLLGLTRDGFVHGLDLRAQVPGEAFKGRPLGGKALGQVARIVGAGIGNRFKPHPLIADLAGHGLHGRDRMRHGAVDFGGGLFHLLRNRDAFGARFARRREQANSRFHHKGIGRRRAAIGARHEAGHDDDHARNERGEATGQQDCGRLCQQRIKADKAKHACRNSNEPEHTDQESSDHHPAATMPGVLEVFRRLLPGQEIPAGRAS